MMKSEKKICLEMMTTADVRTTAEVRRIKLKQLKKRYRYATGGSGRHFLLAFALRKLRFHGKEGLGKKASIKRGAVWTVTSTSQATASSPKEDYVEEEDVSEVEFEENLEQEEWKNDEVEDAPGDEFLLSASFTATGAHTFPSGSQTLLQDDSRAALPDAITSLLDHGLDFDQSDSDDETAPHHWVNLESNSSDPNRKRDALTVIKQLVDMGANIMDQDKNGFNVILAAVNNENWTTVDYLLEKDGVDRMVKIEAMELAGARILSIPYTHSELERAFVYWRQALRLRQLEPVLIKRIPFALKSGQAGEWITSDELEHVIQHPTEYQIQSFLVRLRICSSKSWGAVLDFINEAFQDCLKDLNAQGRLADVIDVLWATWSAISVFDSDAKDLFWKADDIVTNFITVLSQLRRDQHPLLNGETLMLPLNIMIAADEFITYDKNDDSDDSYNIKAGDSDDSYNIKADYYMCTYIKLVTFLARLPFETLTPQIRESLRQLVLQDILFDLKQTFLHTACCNCDYKDLPIIRLLLLSGADPNTVGGNGNTPLHVLAVSQYGNGAVIRSAAHLLFGFGAQLERTNDDGATPADVWIRCHDEADEFNLPEWLQKPVTVPNLKDLCAKVVRSRDVPYDELPPTLIALVEMRELGG